MKLSEFAIEIPDELIADFPADPRDSCRLMVCHTKEKRIEHRYFRDIMEYFDEGDVMILNDTKVFPARLLGRKEKTGANIEVFFAARIEQTRQALGRTRGSCP
jgi:S-adenosylmethionine:tRNA ribosyltransferase-isomerase